METGQTASRAAPVPGPMAEQGARAAMADSGIREAMAGLPLRPRPRSQPPPRPLWLEPYYPPPPPKQIPLGEVEAGSVWLSGGAGTLGCSGGAGIWGHSGKTLNICIKQLSLQLKCSVCWLIIRIVPPGTTVPFPQIFFCLTFFNLTNLNVKCKC